MIISNDVIYVGVNDHQVDLFEGQYVVKNGMSYNSYVIVDDKIAVMDTVDQNFTHQWLDNIDKALKGRKPDFLVVQHMEPDHSANILNFMKNYPNATIVSSEKAFAMMNNYFKTDFADRRIIIKEGNSLPLGKHTLNFVEAPMVHWPEVVMTYESNEKILFSADGFGKFGALDVEEPWLDEARRYFIGIVGKYGAQVQNVLKKAATLDIAKICPLHGPVLDSNLGYYIDLYNTWSSYEAETDGILVAYTSVYGNTKKVVDLFVEKLKAKGCKKVVVRDLARSDISVVVAEAFEYGRIVLATTTYNADIFPYMKLFINKLTERNFQNKTIALIENGSWAPMAARVIKGMLENCKNIKYVEPTITVKSTLSDENKNQIEDVTNILCQDYLAVQEETANKQDLTALFNIGYGLYVVTCNDGNKDNGLIVNTISQVTNTPNRIAVCINKANYSHHVIQQTGIMNVNCLTIETPFSTFQRFGFQSGRNTDKFVGLEPLRSDNGLAFLPKYINSFMSLKVESYVDLDTHGMFICTVTEARVLSKVETVTYNYYQSNIKPKPQTEGKKGYVCKVCGYIYEGETLPDDYVCPLCKHGAADFEPIK